MLTQTTQTEKKGEEIEVKCFVCSNMTFRKIFSKKGNNFYRCTWCKLEMQYPLPSNSEINEYYEDSHEDGLYKVFIDAEDMKQITAKYRFERISGYIKKGKLLDVGCSAGHFVKEANRNGIESEGLDISEAAIKEANIKGIRAVFADLSNYFPGYRFQTITGFDVIEHVLNPIKFIESIKRLLKPGGTLILSTPNLNSIFRYIMGKNWYFYIPEEHLFYFDPNTIKKFLTNEGFKIIKYSRLSKPLTLNYGLTQFKEYNQNIYKMLKFITAIFPQKFNQIAFPFYIGEMLVVAKSANR